MTEIEKLIHGKVETGEAITIKYNGGSQPGSVRQIVPLKLDNGKLIAQCLTSNARKTFDINKISLHDASSEHHGKEWSQSEDNEFEFKNLADFYNSKIQEIRLLGWHIEYSDEIISLHNFTLTGTPRKGYEICLEYNKYSFDLMVDLAANEKELLPYAANIRDRKNPYTVRAPNVSTRVFGRLEKAIKFFMEQARVNSPAPK